jgi:hypothetical protein
MANPEHLEILKQGVEAWNKYTLEGRKQFPDFSGANLRGGYLSRVNFNLANLSGADLTGARLIDSDLSNAILIDADCTDAELDGANLLYTNLEGANFTRANLMFASFVDADLTSACFSEAMFYETRLINVDLSGVKGLETAKHEFRSSIDIATMQSMTTQSIQFYSCFISYSSKDRDFAERIYTDLQNKGVRCWFAPEDLKIGDKIRDRIDESIRLRDKLLLILSESSIESDWVEHEVESAFEEERLGGRTILFPIRLDDAVMDSNKAWAALIRRTRHIGDFTLWKDHDSYQKAFDRLLRDLKAEKKKL